MINLKFLFFIIISILCNHCILAQSMPTKLMSQDSAIHSPSGNWIYIPFGEGSLVIQDRDESKRWIAPSDVGNSFGFRLFREGFIWDIRKISSVVDGKLISTPILFRHPEHPNSGTWEQVGEIDTKFGMPQVLVPLDRPDYFLGIGLLMGFMRDGKSSQIALYKSKNNHLYFDSLIEIPYKNRRHIGESEPISLPSPFISHKPEQTNDLTNLRVVKHNPPSLNLDIWLPVVIPNYIVLGASKAGVLWLFSLSTGDYHSTLDLGEIESSELDKIDLMSHFILGVQADKDGRLIVATRQPEVILTARALYTPPGSGKDLREVNVRRYAEIQKEQTKLCWWSFDPKTGSKERIEDPSVFPEQVPSDRLAAFRFFFDPTGRVITNVALEGWKEEMSRLGINGPTLSTQSAAGGKMTIDQSKKVTTTLISDKHP